MEYHFIFFCHTYITYILRMTLSLLHSNKWWCVSVRCWHFGNLCFKVKVILHHCGVAISYYIPYMKSGLNNINNVDIMLQICGKLLRWRKQSFLHLDRIREVMYKQSVSSHVAFFCFGRLWNSRVGSSHCVTPPWRSLVFKYNYMLCNQ